MVSTLLLTNLSISMSPEIAVRGLTRGIGFADYGSAQNLADAEAKIKRNNLRDVQISDLAITLPSTSSHSICSV